MGAEAPFFFFFADTRGGVLKPQPPRASHHQRERDGPRESGRLATGHLAPGTTPGAALRHHNGERERV